MSTKSDQLDDLVARLQTVRDEDLASEAGAPGAEALFERILADPDLDAEGSALPGRRSLGGRRWLIPAAGLAATAGAVVAIAIGVGPGAETVTPAAAALREAADVARAARGQAHSRPGPGLRDAECGEPERHEQHEPRTPSGPRGEHAQERGADERAREPRQRQPGRVVREEERRDERAEHRAERQSRERERLRGEPAMSSEDREHRHGQEQENVDGVHDRRVRKGAPPIRRC